MYISSASWVGISRSKLHSNHRNPDPKQLFVSCWEAGPIGVSIPYPCQNARRLDKIYRWWCVGGWTPPAG